MPSTVGYKYPLPGNGYGLGKLPPVRRKSLMDQRVMCIGRVWIFLILGVSLIVLGLVSVGVYLNMDSVTSSKEYIEVMPPLVNSGAILLSGLCVSFLFWKRLKSLVLIVVVVCIASGLLCGTTAVLNTTHVLQPIQSFTTCRYYLSQRLCQCLSPYKRDMLSLDYQENDLTKYAFFDAGSCESIQEVLPQLLYTVVVVYGLALLVTLGSAIVALLVLRTETNKRSCFQDENYEEVYTVSGSSSHDQSDSEVEIISANPNQVPVSHSPAGKTPSQRGSNSDTINSNRSGIPSINSNRSGAQTQNLGRSAASSQSSLPQVTNANTKTLTNPRSKTPASIDLGKESLTSRYMITDPPVEREVTYRHRLSKTPDREIGNRRRNSAYLSKRLSKSCDSLESSGRESPEHQQGFWNTETEVKRGKGKLKEHRRKGKRAATVHNLDREQLLLILGLQMRYLQETQEKESQKYQTQNKVNTRRAITPQPSSQKTAIPQKIRSHTPQPYKSHQRDKDPKEKEFYDQIETLLFRSKQKEKQRLANHNEGTWCNKRTRNFSDTSVSNTNIINGNLTGHIPNQRSSNSEERKVESNSKIHTGSESYLTSQQIYKTSPQQQSGHMPYSGPGYSSADSVHYITYADNMLGGKNTKKPKSRASVQNSALPPEPIHRGGKQQLPPQPLSRQNNGNKSLPPQPIHRGSAFQIVDRTSKSRSPSITSDRSDFNNQSLQKSSRKDQADVAIRENFQMHPSPFMLQRPSDGGGRNQSNSYLTNQNAGNNGRRDQTPPTENLPPYSGPPSYHEYVSSCDHSLTSSLSSNPDDIYSMPQRRVQQDNETTNHNYGQNNSTNQKPLKNSNPQSMTQSGGEHIYGNTETFNRAGSRDQFTNGTIHDRSGVQIDNNFNCYGSPARSRVKQFIVPEDYYTPVTKKDPFKQYQGPSQQSLKGQVPMYNAGRGQGQNYNGNPLNRGQGHDRYYGNVVKTDQGRFVHVLEDHQIGPDAKYHEYEDVYETVTPTNIQAGGQGHSKDLIQELTPKQARSLKDHGFTTPTSPQRKPKKKSKESRSPTKSDKFNTVANVNAKVLNFVDQGTNNQVSASSVQNVHAENLRNIPTIKVNSADSFDDDDNDDVFTESNVYSDRIKGYGMNNNKKGATNARALPDPPFDANSRCQTDSNTRNMKNTQNNRPLPEPQTQSSYGYHGNRHVQGQGHPLPQSPQVASLSGKQDSDVCDSGYMKMTLPSSSAGLSANQGDNKDHVTCSSANQSTELHQREVPDGNEAESESQSECEETGV